MIFEYNLFFVSELLAYKEPAVGSHSMYRFKLRFSDIRNAKDLLSAVVPRNRKSGNLQIRQWRILIFRIKNPPHFRDGNLLCFETTLFHVRNRYKHVYRYLAHYYFFSVKY